jgi:hypothetical protein
MVTDAYSVVPSLNVTVIRAAEINSSSGQGDGHLLGHSVVPSLNVTVRAPLGADVGQLLLRQDAFDKHAVRSTDDYVKT